MIWNNSKMASLYYSKRAADENWLCVVKIDDAEISIEYDDDGPARYVGKNDNNGHFELHNADKNGWATLHRSPGALILEGSWEEGGERGMWRVELID